MFGDCLDLIIRSRPTNNGKGEGRVGYGREGGERKELKKNVRKGEGMEVKVREGSNG